MYDIFAGGITPMTLDECKKECAIHSACRGFEYRATGGGHCIPKRSLCQNPQGGQQISDYFYYLLEDAQIFVPYTYLGIGEKYTFVLRVANWMGETASWSSMITKLTVAIPAITMLTGGSSDFPFTFIRSRDVTISAKVTVPECISSAKFNFQWAITAGDDGPPTHLDNTTQRSLSLFVPSLTFAADPLGKLYELSLTATLDGYPAQSNTAVSYLKVMHSDLVASISGGNRVVSSTKRLYINASESNDPDKEQTPFRYQWACQKHGATSGCFDHLPQVSNPNDPMSVSTVDMSRLIFDVTQSTLIVPPGALQADVTYTFTVTASKESRVGGQASVVIKSVAGQPPIINILPVANPTRDSFNMKVNPTERLLLAGDITVLDNNQAVVPTDLAGAVWSVEQGYVNTTAVSQQGLTVIVAADFLTPGLSYTFRLTHTQTNMEAYADLVLQVNSQPYGGLFKIKQQDSKRCSRFPVTCGDEFEKYVMTASDWVDDDQPFLYEFRAQGHDSEDISVRLLAPPLASNSLAAVLPAGNVTVYCCVIDAYGAKAVRTQKLVIPPCSTDCDMMDNLDSLVESGDGLTALAFMGAISSSKGKGGGRRLQDAATGTTALTALQSTILAAVQEVAGPDTSVDTQLSYLEDSQVIALRARLGQVLQPNDELPTKLLQRHNTARLLAKYVQQSRDNLKTSTFLDRIYGSNNPSSALVSVVAGALEALVRRPEELASTVQMKAVDLYESLVAASMAAGPLDASTNAAFRLIGSKLIQGYSELLPPLSALPNLQSYNASDTSSNVVIANYKLRADLVKVLSLRVTHVLDELIKAQLQHKVAGEPPVVSTEVSYSIEARRDTPTSFGRSRTITSATDPNEYFILPSVVLSNQAAELIADFVDYKMTHYKINPLLAAASSMPSERYISNVAALSLYGKDLAGRVVELNVKQIESPIHVSMAVPTAYLNWRNPRKQVYCRYWDTGANSWSTAGCQTVSVSNTTVNCSCSHLTNFGAFLEDGSSYQVPETSSDLGDLFSLVDPGSMHTMIGVGSTFLIYLVGMLWGYRRDLKVRRLEKRARLKSAARSRSSRGGASTRAGTAMSSASSSRGGFGTNSGVASSITGGSTGMLAAANRRLSWRTVFWKRMEIRHLWRSITSKASHPFFSRAQQATVLLTASLTAMFLCAFFLHTPTSSETSNLAVAHSVEVGSAIATGFLSAVIAFPLVNFLSYLFVLCGRLKRSVLESAKYGHKKWRPTSIYTLLWLSSILYSFCILICVSCAFLILLYGTKMDGSQGVTWLVAIGVAVGAEAFGIRPLFCVLEVSVSPLVAFHCPLWSPPSIVLCGRRTRINF
jgi:hypothetical protein